MTAAIAIEQMSAKSKSDIAEVVKSYGRQLKQFIRNRVSTNEQAEDIMQDVWFQFTNTLSSAPIEQVGSWLYTVARNKITDDYRKQKTVSLAEESEDDELSFGELLRPETSTPETEMARKVFWQELNAALAELPPEQRSAFIRHELEGESLQQIADSTNSNIKTVISRKRYAVLHLRERLRQLYDEISNY